RSPRCDPAARPSSPRLLQLTASAAQPVPDPHCGQGAGDLVHPHRPGALLGAVGADRGGRGVPVDSHGADEAFAGGADQHGQPVAADQLPAGQHLPVLFPGLGEAQPGIDDQEPVLDTCLTQPLEAPWPRPCSAMNVGGVPRRVRSRADCRPMSSSARPAETSLTIRAPASTLAAATEARMVSTLTTTSSAASSATTGTTRASSSC